MVQLLLDNNIIIGEALMHAIQIESAEAVEVICKHFAHDVTDEVVMYFIWLFLLLLLCFVLFCF